MLYLIAHWFVGALSLLIVAHIVPGFNVRGFGAALIAALVVGLVNATLGFLLKVLTLPLTFVTFGLFLILINATMLKLAAAFVPGFSVHGFLPAILGAIVLSLVNFALKTLAYSF